MMQKRLSEIEYDNVIELRKDKYTKHLPSICLLFLCVIVGRAFSDVFCYIFLLLSIISIVFFSVQECIAVLCFVLPFSTILKLSVSGISFFTIFYFLILIKLVAYKKTLDGLSTLCFMLLGIYLLFFSGFSQVNTIITMLAGLFIIKIIGGFQFNISAIIISYSSGLIFASILALFKKNLPLINDFILHSSLKIGEGVYANRFAGLQGNPNYYTIDVIFALACLVVVFLYNQPHLIHYLLFGALTVFGLMSVSKSFILSFAFLLLLWFIATIRTGGTSKVTKFILIGAILLGLVYYFAYDSISLYIFRFTQDSGSTFDSISTGRISIWVEYFREIFGNVKILIFGNGLNTVISNGRGAHNTYIESLFNLGVMGITILLTSLRVAFDGRRISRVATIPLLVLLFRMFALGMLTYDNLWLYLIVLRIMSMASEVSSNNNVVA